jgi:hypothetical protein
MSLGLWVLALLGAASESFQITSALLDCRALAVALLGLDIGDCRFESQSLRLSDGSSGSPESHLWVVIGYYVSIWHIFFVLRGWWCRIIREGLVFDKIIYFLMVDGIELIPGATVFVIRISKLVVGMVIGIGMVTIRSIVRVIAVGTIIIGFFIAVISIFFAVIIIAVTVMVIVIAHSFKFGRPVHSTSAIGQLETLHASFCSQCLDTGYYVICDGDDGDSGASNGVTRAEMHEKMATLLGWDIPQVDATQGAWLHGVVDGGLMGGLNIRTKGGTESFIINGPTRHDRVWAVVSRDSGLGREKVELVTA